MTYSNEHLDNPDTYLKLRRAIIRIMGRPDPNLANAARNMDVPVDELTQFIKRHLESPANISKGDLDRLNLKFGIKVPGEKPAAPTASGESSLSGPAARLASYVPSKDRPSAAKPAPDRRRVAPPPSPAEHPADEPDLDGFEIVRAVRGGGRSHAFASVNCVGSMSLKPRLLQWLKDQGVKIEPEMPLLVMVNRRTQEVLIKEAPGTLDDTSMVQPAREHGKDGLARRLNLRSVKDVFPKAVWFSPHPIKGAIVLLKPKT